MHISHGLISADSHGQLDKNTFLDRMSKARWGERIPHIIETRDPALMAEPVDHAVERWSINGKVVDTRGVCNCPAVMDDPRRTYHPQRWEEVPLKVYDPVERLKVLDEDGVDGEVLFPNPPVQNATFLQGDAEFELACIRAYNDGLAEWSEVSPRYIPLALIPYLSDISVAVAEVERAVKKGHKGILMVAEPNLVLQGRDDLFGLAGTGSTTGSVPRINDPYWNPLWDACQELDVPIHWHANAGIILRPPSWKAYNRAQITVSFIPGGLSAVCQFLPNLIFSGNLERYPRLKWVCAETGLGWINYALEACDHEWERRRLWTEGVVTRPSEQFRRQMYVCFWFEKVGLKSRHMIGVDNIMWQSDYPHNTSTYPDSWATVERTLVDVPADERERLLYVNAQNLYKLA